ncbi:hypothetical protein PhCBS80983_g02724 [Powellomyces hirtus]|uniref:Uncharacterized protein n=1 Tax=Powellomyces hirtus TaxID=109895 RepID=A0A507E5D6_9FUNG|nr:hypothetical protein PhCBS80983_g02724 [Powellomyces hirtus]
MDQSDLYFPEGASGLPVLDYLRRRIATFRYICSVHDGTTPYLGTVLLTPDDLAPTGGPSSDDAVKIRKRVLKWFALGLKMGALLGIPNAGDYVRAFSQLMSEYETEPSDKNARERMKRIFSSRNSRNISEQGVSNSSQEANADNSLDMPHMPFEFDYHQTLFAFFEILAAAYEKFLDTPDALRKQAYVDIWMKIDGKIKKIVAVAIKETEAVAQTRFQDELAQISYTD